MNGEPRAKKNNSGVLFKNDKKEEPTHSDYRGDADVEGITYWVNAWINEYTDKHTGEKRKYLAFTLKRKTVRNPPLEKPKKDPDLDIEPADIPF